MNFTINISNFSLKRLMKYNGKNNDHIFIKVSSMNQFQTFKKPEGGCSKQIFALKTDWKKRLRKNKD